MFTDRHDLYLSHTLTFTVIFCYKLLYFSQVFFFLSRHLWCRLFAMLFGIYVADVYDYICEETQPLFCRLQIFSTLLTVIIHVTEMFPICLHV